MIKQIKLCFKKLQNSTASVARAAAVAASPTRHGLRCQINADHQKVPTSTGTVYCEMFLKIVVFLLASAHRIFFQCLGNKI